MARLLSRDFWFGTGSYLIVANDTEDIMRHAVPSSLMRFEFFFYGKELLEEAALLQELRMRVPRGVCLGMWRVARSGGLVVVAREVSTGEIAACRGLSTRTPGNVIRLGKDELFLWASYTLPEYRGMSLQAITLQEGIRQLERTGVLKKKAVGIVKPDNDSSLRGLAKVGLRPCGWLVERRFFHVIHVVRGVDSNQHFVRLELAL